MDAPAFSPCRKRRPRRRPATNHLCPAPLLDTAYSRAKQPPSNDQPRARPGRTPMTITRRAVSVGLGAGLGASLGLALLPRRAFAAFPARPIPLIVPCAAGGNADIVGRLTGQIITEHLKQPVVVENRAGAGGSLG